MGIMDWLKGLGGKKSTGDSDKVVMNHEEQVATTPTPGPSTGAAPAPGPQPTAPDAGSKADTV
jgi:hypothetical protein